MKNFNYSQLRIQERAFPHRKSNQNNADASS